MTLYRHAKRAHMARVRAARKARHRCLDCGGALDTPHVRCAVCRAKCTAYTRAYQRRSHHPAPQRPCTVCGDPLRPGTRRSASRHAGCGWKADGRRRQEAA